MEDIFDFIVDVLGFEREGDSFKKSQVRIVRQVIVNGERHDESAEFNYEIRYLGDGFVENVDGSKHEETHGFKFLINGNDLGDIWVRSSQEFALFLSERR